MLFSTILRQCLTPCDTPSAQLQKSASMYKPRKCNRFALTILAVVGIIAAGCYALSVDNIKQDAAAYQPWLIETRRALHAQPELMYQELETSKFIRNTLDNMKVQYR